MELKTKDRKMLYWLDQDSRATNKVLSKKVGLSEQGIGYKLKALEEAGVIKKYVTFVNTLSLGYSHFKVLLRLQNIQPDKESELIQYLTQHHNVRWVVTCSGSWDINFSIMAKDPQEFISIYRQIENMFGKFIAEKNVSVLYKSPGFTKGYLLNQNSMKTLQYKSEGGNSGLDKIDLNILNSISQDARKSTVRVANELKTTVDVIRYRIKKLERIGIISGYTTQLDLKKMGLQRYSVFFSIQKMNDQVETHMIEFAKINNNIIFILFMVGTYDISLELEVQSYDVLEEVIKKFRKRFAENVKDFEIILNTNEYKYDFFPFKTTKV